MARYTKDSRTREVALDKAPLVGDAELAGLEALVQQMSEPALIRPEAKDFYLATLRGAVPRLIAELRRSRGARTQSKKLTREGERDEQMPI